MLNKIYKKFKDFIREHHNYLLFLIFFALILNAKLPYSVYRPGGIIPLRDRIKVNNKNINENYYVSYVTVNEGTLMTVLMSYMFPNWDLVDISLDKDDDNSYKKNNDYAEAEMLSSNKMVQKLVLDKLGINYEMVNKKVKVISSINGYDNKLKNKDTILKCNGKKISNTDELEACVNADSSKNSAKLLIRRDNKDKEVTVKLYLYHGRKIIGVTVYNDYDIKSEYNLDIISDDGESGSSGGLLSAIALYDNLTDDDLAKGRKISGTGALDNEGNVIEIGGVKYKLLGAEDNGIDVYFVPQENYIEAINVKKDNNLKLNIVSVSTFDDAVSYLKEN